MKLTFVKLISSSYDPRVNSRHPMHGVTDFDAANGYEMELRDGYVTIAHSGRTALYSLGRVDHSLVATETVKPVRWTDTTGGIESIRFPEGFPGPSIVTLYEPPEPPLTRATEAVFADIADEADAARETLTPPDMTPAEVVASIASAAPERKKKRRR